MLLTKETRIGPQHHGRKMSLRKYEFVKIDPGYQYELARGYIVVSETPNYPHSRVVLLLNRALFRYDATHVGVIDAIYGGNDSKLLSSEWESERHPDISVYLDKATGPKNRTLWRRWIPELVIEVVSEGSRDRDYTEKRDEYWTIGVKEYWIVDAKLKQVLVLTRGRSQWKETTLTPKDSCETKLLPGFKLSCKAIFDAAGDEE